jgi:hypothetical protein
VSTERLAALIHQLRNAASPIQRLKLVALAWRTLRGMSRADRIAIAREIGLEGAEKLVDGLADRQGISPSAVLSAIKKAEYGGTSSPKKLLAGLLGGAVAALAESARAEVFEAEQETETEETAEPFASVFEPAHPEPPAAAPEAPAIEPLAEPEEPEPEPEVTAPDTGQAPAAPPATAARPEPAPVIMSAAEPVPPPVTEIATIRDATATTDLDSALLRDLAGATQLMSRLRMLGRRAAEAEDHDREQLLQLLELFPAGWSRRRALETLIRAGVPSRLDDLLVLISVLSRPSERLWALTTLVETRQLSRDESEHLLDAAEHPALRRRLRLRTARSPSESGSTDDEMR